MLQDRETADEGAIALIYVGGPALAVLMRALKDTNDFIRLAVVDGVRGAETVPDELLAQVLTMRHDSDERVAAQALWAAMIKKRGPEAVVLGREALRDSRPYIQSVGLVLLPQFGTNSNAAIPTILSLLESTNAPVRRGASNALTQIDPVVAAKHGINTNDFRLSDCFW